MGAALSPETVVINPKGNRLQRSRAAPSARSRPPRPARSGHLRHPSAVDVTSSERRAAGRFAGTSAVGLLVLVGAALGLAALLWLLAGPLVALDRAVADAANAVVAPRPVLVAVLEAVTALGATLTGVVVLTTLALALSARGRFGLALYVAVAGLGGSVLSPAVKELVGRLRPEVDDPVATAPGFSFPSGHTVTVTLWVGVVLLVLLPAIAPRARRPMIGVGIAVVVLVGLTRIALGVHYLSDVVGGWLFGVAWLAVTVAAFRAWRRSEGHDDVPLALGLAPEAAPDLAPVPDHGRPTGRRRVRAAQLLVIAVLLLGVMLGTGWLVTAVETGSAVEAVDVAVVRWFADHRTGPLDAVSGPVGELGNTGVVIVLGLVASVLALAVLRRVRPVVLIAVALVGQLLIFMATATIIDRERPPVPHLDAELPPTSSFPSGHVGAAIALYGALAVLVLGATRAWWRWIVVAVAVSAVVLVAVSRLYRGAHHPSDVLASVLLAVPWLLATVHVLRVGPHGSAVDARSETGRTSGPAG